MGDGGDGIGGEVTGREKRRGGRGKGEEEKEEEEEDLTPPVNTAATSATPTASPHGISSPRHLRPSAAPALAPRRA